MLTDKDINRLTAVLATKKDLVDLKETVEGLQETVQGLATSLDGLVKVLEDLRVEYGSIKMQLDRHEEWIRQIAKKSGLVLTH